MDKRDPIIVSAVRTAIGDFGGAFRDVQHTDLASHVMREVCGRVDNFPKEEVGDVYWGVVMVRSDENGLARCAMLQAGLPVSSSAVQMNRACCSSMEAIRVACMSIRQGESDAIVAGGGESMSNVPYSIKGARWGLKMRHQVLSDGVWDGLSDQYTGLIMGLTAENVAEEYGISRKEQDEFAYRSQINAKKALETGRFKDEIAPFVIQGKHGKPDKIIDTDEHPRPNTTLEGLSKLPPAFKENGTVTAGNSSGINDGASAVLIVSRELADRLGLTRRWRVVGAAAVGVEPRIMGIGPIPAVRKLMKRTGYSVEDMQLVEMNEAFAAPSIASARELGIKTEILNVNGGGIALGHPIGNTGCRLVVTLIHELEKRGLERGLATLCGGSGHGMAVIIEKD